MENKTVAVLMATYNGEKFLTEQIDSILMQTCQAFRLIVADDGSKDRTVEILKSYAKKYPKKIQLLNFKDAAGGASKNFMRILKRAMKDDYEVFMFADQDDVWLPDKIQLMVNAYERTGEKERPVLVHSDLRVVNAELELESESFMEFSNFDPNEARLNKILVQNNVTGCTMLVNRALAAQVDEKIEGMIMHDWYFALIAAAMGQIVYVDTPTIMYRQHNENTLGAKKNRGAGYVYRKLVTENNMKTDMEKIVQQGISFAENYKDRVSGEAKTTLTEFLKLKEQGKLGRVANVVKNGFMKYGVMRQIGEILCV